MTKTTADGLAAYALSEDLRAAKMRMGRALPDEGWLADYVRAVTPLTDAPVEFHLVSGLCALSAAIGNRLYVEHWGQNVFPHLWAVLVAPSSFWRKSTSINQAERLLQAAAPDQMLPSDFSREKLLALLAKQPTGMMTMKEFGGFLSMLGADYNGGLKENLTELYDGPDLYKRALQSGVFEVRRPALTLLGATTLDWLEAKIVEGDLAGGFLPRFLWVTAREKASPKGLTGGMDAGLRIQLTTALHAISIGADRAVVYDAAGRELLDDWMAGWETEAMRTNHRSDLSGFAVRLQTYAIKLAMLYRVARTYGDDLADHKVDELAVSQAIAYCRLLWANVTGLIDDQIATTKEAKELRRIVGIIGAGTTRSNALRLSKLKASDFEQYQKTLVQSGQITVEQVRGSEVGLDRKQDKQVTWLAPAGSSNGHGSPVGALSSDLSVIHGSPSVPGEPSIDRNPVEPTGPDASTDTYVSSHFTTSSTPDDSGRPHGGIHARGEGEPSDDALIARLSKLSTSRRIAVLIEVTGGTIDELTLRRELDDQGVAVTVARLREGLIVATTDEEWSL